MELLDFKYYDYDRFRIEPLTKWADIIEGETYHIGPTIIYPRRDFLCEHKETDRLVGKVLAQDIVIDGEVKFADGTLLTKEVVLELEKRNKK